MFQPGLIFEHIHEMDWNELDRSFPLLAAGSSRWVYEIDRDCVAKIAVNKDGHKQCKVEDYVYSHTDDYLKRYLCPVIWYAPGMVVMPKAKPFVPLHTITGDYPIDPQKMKCDNKIFMELRYLSKKFDLAYDDLISITSWGFLGKNPVLVDYGCKD